MGHPARPVVYNRKSLAHTQHRTAAASIEKSTTQPGNRPCHYLTPFLAWDTDKKVKTPTHS